MRWRSLLFGVFFLTWLLGKLNAQVLVWQEWEHQAPITSKFSLQSDLSFRNYFSNQHIQLFARTTLQYGNADKFLGIGILGTDKDLAVESAWEKRVFLKLQTAHNFKAWSIRHLVRPEFSQMGELNNWRMRYMQTWRKELEIKDKELAFSFGDEIVLDGMNGLFAFNRIGIGLEQAFGQNFRMQLQYIYQIAESNEGAKLEQLHILRLQIRFKTGAKASQKP